MPNPWGGELGFVTTLQILRAFNEPCRHYPTHQQFPPIRKLKYAYTNLQENLPQIAYKLSYFRSHSGSVVRLSRCETDSALYYRFCWGLYRMVRKVRHNKDLYHRLLHLILGHLNMIIFNILTTVEERYWILMVGSYLLITFAVSL